MIRRDRVQFGCRPERQSLLSMHYASGIIQEVSRTTPTVSCRSPTPNRQTTGSGLLGPFFISVAAPGSHEVGIALYAFRRQRSQNIHCTQLRHLVGTTIFHTSSARLKSNLAEDRDTLQRLATPLAARLKLKNFYFRWLGSD